MGFLRYLGAGLIVVQGGVDLQQLVDFMSAVPYVGPLFALDAAVSALIAVALAARRGLAAPLAGIAVSIGALASVALAFTVGLFGYMEVSLRPAVALAVGVEAVGVGVLGAYAVARLRDRSSRSVTA